jgi:hypothetical protein
MAGLVPAIPIMKMKCPPNRDRRDEPGDDVSQAGTSVPTEAALTRSSSAAKCAYYCGLIGMQ